MGVIRRLPPSVVNQIAAGEVVERPASVVKELMENAIDAGATRVDLAVERGGKDLVRVADDGKGMSPDDLPLAFTPHATSKLAEAEDLYRVRTLGFRGEALAAIAEVSKTRCQTREAGAESGSEIVIEAGVASEIRPCACAPGTVIEVRHLFHNTPVRRAFLKSDATEAGHVVEMFTRVALAHPTVRFSYRSSGKVIHDLPSVTGMKERIALLLGREIADALIWVESEVENCRLWGYVGHPSESRSATKGQFFFVGGRFVRDRSLSHALAEAYRGLLMTGRYPIAFLNLELPPDQVDVNVHPSKIEVRFRDGHLIYSQLLATLRQSFLASDLHSRLQARSDAPPPAPPPTTQGTPQGAESSWTPREPYALSETPPTRESVSNWFGPPASGKDLKIPPPEDFLPAAVPDWAKNLPPRSSSASRGALFSEFEDSPESTSPNAADAGRPTIESPSPSPNPSPPPPPLRQALEETPRSQAVKAIQLHDSYLVVETAEGMVVIDQHALHERILYEEFKRRLNQGGVESQRLLVPVPADLSGTESAAVLERREALERLGLLIEPFGGDTVLISAVPAMLRHTSPERLLRDLAEGFRDRPTPPSIDAILEDVLAMMACKAAVKAGDRLAPEEIDALLARRNLADDAHHCPHGRPAGLIFTRAELEKQFGRI